jgi:hypothetical protein
MGETRPQLDLTRPRSIGELLSTTVALFVRHFGLFVSVTLLVVAPVVVFVDGVWGRALRDGSHAHAGTGASTASAVLASFVIPAFVTGLHAVIVRSIGSGTVPDVGRALRDVAPRLPAAFGAVALYALGTAIGFLLLIVPGIWIGVRWYFATQAAVLDQAAPSASLRHSAALVDGRWWEAFGALLTGGVLFGGASALAQAAAGLVHEGVAYVTLLTVIQAVALSLSALFGTLLFFTLHARRAAAQAPTPA